MPFTKEPPLRLPKQFDADGRHGVSGYRGNVIVEGAQPAAPVPAKHAKKAAPQVKRRR